MGSQKGSERVILIWCFDWLVCRSFIVNEYKYNYTYAYKDEVS